MIIKKSDFVTSIASSKNLSDLNLPEFAFVGRSNVGKSSLINYLTNRKKLAKASSTPGRTRLINLFKINDEFYFVDLPGYGFAQASKREQAGWQNLIGTYLENSKNLKRVFVLVDARHKPTQKDELMLNYLYTFNIPFSVVATKIDKLSKSELQKQIGVIASTLGIGTGDILKVSSQNNIGKEQILSVIENLI